MYSIFDDKDYGVAVIDKRGRISIPLRLQKELKIKPGDQFIFFAKSGDNMVSFLPEKELKRLLEHASRTISKLKINQGP